MRGTATTAGSARSRGRGSPAAPATATCAWKPHKPLCHTLQKNKTGGGCVKWHGDGLPLASPHPFICAPPHKGGSRRDLGGPRPPSSFAPLWVLWWDRGSLREGSPQLGASPHHLTPPGRHRAPGTPPGPLPASVLAPSPAKFTGSFL